MRRYDDVIIGTVAAAKLAEAGAGGGGGLNKVWHNNTYAYCGAFLFSGQPSIWVIKQRSPSRQSYTKITGSRLSVSDGNFTP